MQSSSHNICHFDEADPENGEVQYDNFLNGVHPQLGSFLHDAVKVRRDISYLSFMLFIGRVKVTIICLLM